MNITKKYGRRSACVLQTTKTLNRICVMKKKYVYEKNIIKIKTNKMKNNEKETQSDVKVFSRDGKYKGVRRPVMYEGEKYIIKENEMIFYLRENPKCQVQAVGVWRENAQGKVVGDVDTYFIHILSFHTT